MEVSGNTRKHQTRYALKCKVQERATRLGVRTKILIRGLK